jgi:hypothetical protein
MGTASGVGFTPAAPMADDGGSGGSARARGEQLGRVYMGAGGRLGGRGVNHVAGANARGYHPQWHAGAAHGPLGPPVPWRACAARVRPLAWHVVTPQVFNYRH